MVYPVGVCAFRGKGEVEALRENDEAKEEGWKMLKKIMVVVRRELLKVDWIRLAVADYRLRMKEGQPKPRLDLIVNSGQVRNLKPKKLDAGDTLTIVEDGLVEEFKGGKRVHQGYIDSTQWGGVRL